MRSSRVLFIDLARTLAVVAMVYGHTIDAVLDPGYRVGQWFTAWQFQRGLTSCLFLLLSGFAFSIATTRHWTLHTSLTPQVMRRARRFVLFIALGYALHLPVSSLRGLPGASVDQWHSFMRVDVLQLIGVTFLFVQVLVLITRTRRAFAVTAAALALGLMIASPMAWSFPWDTVLPAAVGAYISPATGSLFPLVPWSAYVLLGAALGQVYARWPATDLARFANLVLLLPGVVLVSVGATVHQVPAWLFARDPWGWVPPQLVLRAGSCLLVLGATAHASARLTRLPHVFSAVAQESLLIYFVHLCIVYGSVWNAGLAQRIGRTLDPLHTVLIVIPLLASMTALAAYWSWQKHVSPRAARGIVATAWAAMAVPLM